MTALLGFARYYGPHMRRPWMWGCGLDGTSPVLFFPFAGIGLLLGLAVVGLIAYLVVRLVRGSRTPASAGPADDATAKALAILKERFARGEIGESEYERRRARLLDLPAPAPEPAEKEPADRSDA